MCPFGKQLSFGRPLYLNVTFEPFSVLHRCPHTYARCSRTNYLCSQVICFMKKLVLHLTDPKYSWLEILVEGCNFSLEYGGLCFTFLVWTCGIGLILNPRKLMKSVMYQLPVTVLDSQ